MATAEVCRRHGDLVGDLLFLEVEVWRSDAKRLKALEDENRKLKKHLAEQMLDNATLKEMLTKNSLRIRDLGRQRRFGCRRRLRMGIDAGPVVTRSALQRGALRGGRLAFRPSTKRNTRDVRPARAKN